MGDSKSRAGDEPETQPKRDGATGSEAADSLSFEGALERLERTVSRLEAGEMPLEEAMELFESGVRLSRQCHETLQAAERRIEILVADRGAGGVGGEDWKTEGFESDSNVEDDLKDDFEDEPEEIED